MIAPDIVGLIGSVVVTLAGFTHLLICPARGERWPLRAWAGGGVVMCGAWLAQLWIAVR